MTRFKTLIASAAAIVAAGAAQAAPLTVTVDGIEARGGNLYVGVQTEAQFMQPDGVAGEMFAAPDAGSKTVTFELPEGAYSISVWHDFNGNGVFDLNEAGRPADGWSMVGAEDMRAKPTFDAASLTLPGAGTATTLKMFYPN